MRVLIVHLFTVPFPPSINELWRWNYKQRGLVASPRYEKWIVDAGWILKISRRSSPSNICIPGAFAARIRLDAARFGKVDADNVGAKAVLDLAQAHRLIANDRWARLISIGWGRVEPGSAEVRLREMP